MGTFGDGTGIPQAMDLVLGLDLDRVNHAIIAVDDIDPRPLAGIQQIHAGDVDAAGQIKQMNNLDESSAGLHMGRAQSFVASHLGAPLKIPAVRMPPRAIRSVKALIILRRGASEGQA